jgi:hypothetical protein
VSHRHQANRRRTYGRRQHELRERVARSHPRDLPEFDSDPFEAERVEGSRPHWLGDGARNSAA